MLTYANRRCKALGCQRGAIFGGVDTAWARTFCRHHCQVSHTNLAYKKKKNAQPQGFADEKDLRLVSGKGRCGRCVFVYVCMYLYVSLYIYIHTFIMHTCIHSYMHTCIHTYIHTYIHTCTCIGAEDTCDVGQRDAYTALLPAVLPAQLAAPFVQYTSTSHRHASRC